MSDVSLSNLYDARKKYESLVMSHPKELNNWLRYASWEESQAELERARSIFERCLTTLSHAQQYRLWIAYADLEMRCGEPNSVKNVFQRALDLLPFEHRVWWRYTTFLEALGDFGFLRRTFQDWLTRFAPKDPRESERAVLGLVSFEKKYEKANARRAYEMLVGRHGSVTNWLSYGTFLESPLDFLAAQSVYRRAIQATAPTAPMAARLYERLARLERTHGTVEAARAVYRAAMDTLPPGATERLANEYLLFEQQHGGQDDISAVVTEAQTRRYAAWIEQHPEDWAARLECVAMLEATRSPNLMDTIQMFIGHPAPPSGVGRGGYRGYMAFMDHVAGIAEIRDDRETLAQVHEALIDRVDHGEAGSGKPFKIVAYYYLRRHDLDTARRVLDHGLTETGGAHSLFEAYVDIETALQATRPIAALAPPAPNKVRDLYQQWSTAHPTDGGVAESFAKYEAMIGRPAAAMSVLRAAAGGGAGVARVYGCMVDLVTAIPSAGDVRAICHEWVEAQETVGVAGLAVDPACYLRHLALPLDDVDGRFRDAIIDLRRARDADVDEVTDDELALRVARGMLLEGAGARITAPPTAVEHDDLEIEFGDVDRDADEELAADLLGGSEYDSD